MARVGSVATFPAKFYGNRDEYCWLEKLDDVTNHREYSIFLQDRFETIPELDSVDMLGYTSARETVMNNVVEFVVLCHGRMLLHPGPSILKIDVLWFRKIEVFPCKSIYDRVYFDYRRVYPPGNKRFSCNTDAKSAVKDQSTG